MLQVNYRISLFGKVLMITFAAMADLIQLVLVLVDFTVILIPVAYVLSMFLSFLVYGINGFIFIISGVKPFSGNRMVQKIGLFGASFAVEFIPVVGQFIPTLTLWTWITIRQSRVEDKIKHKKEVEDAKIREAQRKKRIQVLRERQMQQLQQEAQVAVVANDNTQKRGSENFRPRARVAYKNPERSPANRPLPPHSQEAA